MDTPALYRDRRKMKHFSETDAFLLIVSSESGIHARHDDDNRPVVMCVAAGGFLAFGGKRGGRTAANRWARCHADRPGADHRSRSEGGQALGVVLRQPL